MRATLVFVLWVSLGAWIGAMLLFATVVAPTAFRELASPEVAGRVVGPTLAAIHLYGAAAGVGIAGLTLALGRGRGLAALSLVLALLCLYSHFGVTAQIAELGEAAFGAAPQAEAQRRFAALHQRSVALFAVVGVGVLVAAALHARSEAHPVGGGPGG